MEKKRGARGKNRGKQICPSAIFYALLHEDVWKNGSKLFIYVYLFVYMN
jgi:hypothetical protein